MMHHRAGASVIVNNSDPAYYWEINKDHGDLMCTAPGRFSNIHQAIGRFLSHVNLVCFL